jgi:elongation factor 2
MYCACELTAEPRILEPVYETEIITTNNVIANVYTCLNMRRGIVLDG